MSPDAAGHRRLRAFLLLDAPSDASDARRGGEPLVRIRARGRTVEFVTHPDATDPAENTASPARWDWHPLTPPRPRAPSAPHLSTRPAMLLETSAVDRKEDEPRGADT